MYCKPPLMFEADLRTFTGKESAASVVDFPPRERPAPELQGRKTTATQLTWSDVWEAARSYKPDSVDALCGLALLAICMIYSWLIGDWLKGMTLGPLMCASGWMAVEMLIPLWKGMD
jgi:hypothetical protein